MRGSLNPAQLDQGVTAARAPLGGFKKHQLIASAVDTPENDPDALDGGQAVF